MNPWCLEGSSSISPEIWCFRGKLKWLKQGALCVQQGGSVWYCFIVGSLNGTWLWSHCRLHTFSIPVWSPVGSTFENNLNMMCFLLFSHFIHKCWCCVIVDTMLLYERAEYQTVLNHNRCTFRSFSHITFFHWAFLNPGGIKEISGATCCRVECMALPCVCCVNVTSISGSGRAQMARLQLTFWPKAFQSTASQLQGKTYSIVHGSHIKGKWLTFLGQPGMRSDEWR